MFPTKMTTSKTIGEYHQISQTNFKQLGANQTRAVKLKQYYYYNLTYDEKVLLKIIIDILISSGFYHLI